jgi:serine/threonine-protein kinase
MASTAPSPLRERPIQFGKYTLLARIAGGGMGELFLAQLRSAGGFAKLVVIKRILSHLTDKPEFVDLFVEEARTAARITHPNVCQIYELGQVDGRYYMALEYLEGLPLADVMVARKKAPQLADLRLIASLVGQSAEGLHHAHSLREPDGESAGVVHRDVNPRNIFVTSAGVAKVLDFGIVKVRSALSQIQTGAVKGTYSYMSPEQLQGEAVDCTADIFSLGTITWEAVVGRRLFKRSSDLLTWRAIVEDPIPHPTKFRPDLPPELDEVIMRALRRPLGERFSSAREFAAALAQSIQPLGAPLTSLAVAEEMEKAFAIELGAQRERVFAAHRRQEEGAVEPASDGAAAEAQASSAGEADAADDGVIDDWFGGGSHTRVADPGYAELVAKMVTKSSNQIAVPAEPLVDVPSDQLELTEEVIPPAAALAASGPARASGSAQPALPRPSQLPYLPPPPSYVVEDRSFSAASPVEAPAAPVDPILDDESDMIIRPRRRWPVVLALTLSAAAGATMVLALNRGKDDRSTDAERPPETAASVVAPATANMPAVGARPTSSTEAGAGAQVAPAAGAASAPAAGVASAPAAGVASAPAAGVAGLPAPAAGEAGAPAPATGVASAPADATASGAASPSTGAASASASGAVTTPGGGAAAAAPSSRDAASGSGDRAAAAPGSGSASKQGRDDEREKRERDKARDARKERRAEKAASERGRQARKRDADRSRGSAKDRPRVASASAAVTAARGGGYLTVNAEPYATLFVDGKRRGFTPVVRLSLPPGDHSLRLVSSAGQPDKKFRVRIVSGQELRKFFKW